jgi:hypothetical protein
MSNTIEIVAALGYRQDSEKKCDTEPQLGLLGPGNGPF